MKKLLLLSGLVLSGKAMEQEDAKMLGLELCCKMLGMKAEDTYKSNYMSYKIMKQDEKRTSVSSLRSIENLNYELFARIELAGKHTNIDEYSKQLVGDERQRWENEFDEKLECDFCGIGFLMEVQKSLMTRKEVISCSRLLSNDLVYQKMRNTWIRFKFQNPSVEWKLTGASSDELMRALADYRKLIGE